ncbi:MAG: NAD(P)-dependent oxidoreductase [Oligoflexia bacterium]|nr:NAD(P)-dependent oxidoreductase [Oligoflexia bacterium]
MYEAAENPIETIKSNVLSTAYILEACRKNKVKRFIYASTIYVYSEQGSFYRSSKQSAELFIENYQQIYGVDYTVLRYGSLYGKRANKFNFIRQAIHQAITEKKIMRLGDGEEIRDYINVLDAARASVDILEEEYVNKYIMVTGMQTIKVKDLLNMIKEILQGSVEIQYMNAKSDNTHYQITPYSYRPKVAMKYIPKYFYDLGQGILDCIYEVDAEIKYKNSLKTIDSNVIEVRHC